MSATPAQRSPDDVKRYLNLEESIRELTYMAGIARDIAYELLGVETPETEEVILRMSKRQRDQLWFAIDKGHDMARELEALYYRQNREAHT